MTYGFGYGRGFGFGAPAIIASYVQQASDYFDAITVAPSNAWLAATNALIAGMVDDGGWTNLDGLWLAVPTAQGMRVNAPFPAQVGTEHGTLTYDYGYTGDGVTGYVDTGINLTTNGNYTRNDCSMFLWTPSASVASGMVDAGTISGRINSQSSPTTAQCRIGGALNYSPTDGGAGFHVATRTDAVNAGFSRNAGALAWTANASQMLNTANVCMCAGGSTPSPVGFSSRKIEVFGFGSNLNDAQISALYAAVAAWRTEIGL